MAKNTITVDVDGQAELERKVNQINEGLKAKILDRAVQEGAEVARKDAAKRAPRRSGRLAKSIIKENTVDKTANIAYDVGHSQSAFYGMFVEIGTEDQPKQPFLRPALDENQSAIQRAVGRIIKDGVFKVTGI